MQTLATAVPSPRPERRVPVFRTILALGAVVIFLNIAVVTVLVVRRAEAAVHAAAVRDLHADCILVRQLLRDLPQKDAEAVMTRLAVELGVRFSVIASDGRVVLDSLDRQVIENHASRPEVAQALAGQVGIAVRESATVGDRQLYVAVPAIGQPYVVRTSRRYAEVEAQAADVRNATIAVTVGAGVGALTMFLVFARRLVNRLEQEMRARAETDRERLRAEQMFRDFVETTTEWIWAVDTNFTITYSNPAVRDILGYPTDDIVGHSFFSYVHPDEAPHVEREVTALKAAQVGWRDLVVRCRHQNGSYRFLESTAVPIIAADGSLQGYRGADRDVTDRREAERMKSDFVSFVSHQLRTPLAGMKWMMELAAGAKDLPPQAQEYISHARASADRLALLVNDLLDIARLESGRVVLSKERVALDQLTREVISEFDSIARAKGVALTSRLDGPVIVRADGQMMRQVLTNLVSNAVKYTASGGQVSVSLEAKSGLARWQVRDTGLGIPKAAQSRLFEKFFRADNAISLESEGTGLGLHLVRLILEHSGGRIWVESEEERGATFTFTLPADESNA